MNSQSARFKKEFPHAARWPRKHADAVLGPICWLAWVKMTNIHASFVEIAHRLDSPW